MKRIQISVALFLSFALLAACQATHPRAAPAPVDEDAAALSLEQATDPCAMRMQDIIGQLLAYYAIHADLPANLAALRPLADPGMDTTYTCPVSGEPYVYIPGGAAANGLRDRLILYDAVPVHHGLRWAVTMKPPIAGQVQMFVIPLSDRLLKAYLPNAGGG